MRIRDESLFGKIIDFVNEYFEDYGRSPSTREIEQGIAHPAPRFSATSKPCRSKARLNTTDTVVSSPNICAS